jgi:hypothetical protein
VPVPVTCFVVLVFDLNRRAFSPGIINPDLSVLAGGEEYVPVPAIDAAENLVGVASHHPPRPRQQAPTDTPFILLTACTVINKPETRSRTIATTKTDLNVRS